MSCYKFTELHYKDPIFKTVEATYIIHLEGNGRLPAIESQLQRFHPTETVYIAFNKGYKKCKKDEQIDKPPLDLVDAFFAVFRDAEQKGYEHILVLEDDFIFDDDILDKQHPVEIERFLMEKRGQSFVYYVGVLPFLQLSTFGFHNRVFMSSGTHACIYTKAFIKNLVHNVPQNTVNDWDVYTSLHCTQYKYHKSLCYQIFPETENQKHWGDGNFLFQFLSKYILIPFHNYLELNKTVYPGYNIMEFTSKYIVWFIIITTILINIVYFVYAKNNYKLLNKHWNYYIYIYLGKNLGYPIFIILVYLLMLFIVKMYHK
jgi:hypothetical protein